jgi:formylglycine-generating enzyme required for sulfatase activity
MNIRKNSLFALLAILALLSSADGRPPQTATLEAARNTVQQISTEMGQVLRERREAEKNGQPVVAFDARLKELEAKRYPALKQVVQAENPTAFEANAKKMQFFVPVPGAPSGTVNGRAGILVAWHARNLDPINGQFMGYSRGAGPDPSKIDFSNQSLAGSSNWSSFYPYPGDYDCSEEWGITKAPNASTAADRVVEELIKFGEYHQTKQFPNFELARLGIRWVDPATGARGRPDAWNLEQLVGARTNAATREEIKKAVLNLRGGRVVFNFYVLLNDGRLTHMQKVLGVLALNPADPKGAAFFTAEVPFPELLDGSPDSTDGDLPPFFRSQQISANFQEIFTVKLASEVDPQGLGEYASLMRTLALKEVGLDQDGNPLPGNTDRRYLKAANRAFSYLRTIGNIQAMDELKPVYQTKFLLMNQRQQMLELLAERALDPRFPSRIITAAKAKEQAEGAANDIQSLDPALSARLREIASKFRGRGTDPNNLTQPLQTDAALAKELETLTSDISNALDAAVATMVKPVIDRYVVPFADLPPATQAVTHEDAFVGSTAKIPLVQVSGGKPYNSNIVVPTFWIGRFEVTWSHWQHVRDWAVANGYPDLANSGAGSGPMHPVRNVNWHEAVKWCNALSEMEGLTPAYLYNGSPYRTGEHGKLTVNRSVDGYRLPTGDEWYFAAKGGAQSKGFWCSGSNDPKQVAWYLDNSIGAEVVLKSGRGTWPVGLKAANELGIHDMSGNVSEWSDEKNTTYLGPIPITDIQRLTCGGWWGSEGGRYGAPGELGDLHVRHSVPIVPNFRSYSIGLRVVRSR